MAGVVLPKKSCDNNIPVDQSLSRRPPADQSAKGLWVWDWSLMRKEFDSVKLTGLVIVILYKYYYYYYYFYYYYYYYYYHY